MNKLEKFAEMEQLECVVQAADFTKLQAEGFALKGNWARKFFGNDKPIVLELGCGKGEYTVGLAKQQPDKNFIGIDIKGARMHTGAKQAEAEKLDNVAFLRTHIEFLEMLFAADEVSELWITFPDPQMSKPRKRLVGVSMLKRYAKFVKTGGLVHLKSDSNFLLCYMRELIKANGIKPLVMTEDLYDRQNDDAQMSELLANPRAIQTYYEQKWLNHGLSIKYVKFGLPAADVVLEEPDEALLPKDSYHSVGRGVQEYRRTNKRDD